MDIEFASLGVRLLGRLRLPGTEPAENLIVWSNLHPASAADPDEIRPLSDADGS
jgi:hypothetical protein